MREVKFETYRWDKWFIKCSLENLTVFTEDPIVALGKEFYAISFECTDWPLTDEIRKGMRVLGLHPATNEILKDFVKECSNALKGAGLVAIGASVLGSHYDPTSKSIQLITTEKCDMSGGILGGVCLYREWHGNTRFLAYKDSALS